MRIQHVLRMICALTLLVSGCAGLAVWADANDCIPLLWMSPLACPLPFGGLPFNTGTLGDLGGPDVDGTATFRISFPDGLTETTSQYPTAVLVQFDGPPGHTVALLYDRELGEVWFGGAKFDLTEYCQTAYLGSLPDDGHTECEFVPPFIIFPEAEEVFYFQAMCCELGPEGACEKSEVIKLIVVY